MSEDFPAHLAGFRSGSLLAGYRLEAQVGAGGFAVVFRARDERLGRLVALKILAPALAADAAFRRRFMAESRAAAAVDDPYIIPVYEAGEADGVLFIAMRFVAGGDLRGVLDREGPLGPGRAASFISPVASALDAAHRAGLVHRDVKPANILVDARPDRPDHVYLSDFGVSKGAVSSVSLTGAGHFVGTPDYSAPEQIGGLAVDGRADQYALACVAYQLLTGSTPFEREQGMAVLFAHMSAPPPSLSARRPDLPRAADQVLTRALSKTPEDRYGSCRDFADALREALRLPPYISLDSAPAAEHPRAGVASPRPEFPGPDLAGSGKAAIPAGPAAAATVGSAPGGGSATRGQRAGSDPRTGGGVQSAPRPRHRVVGRPSTRTAWIRSHRALVIAVAGAVLGAAGVVPFALANSPGHQPSSIIYKRGSILTSDGVTIAESTPINDNYKYQRKYPHGAEYAPVTGYDTLYHETGIEYYENGALKDSNVTLTINSKAQDAAWNALQATTGGKPGAVVALNPQTGAILAMASYPSYDPNVLATHDGKQLNQADQALLRQAGNPLLNRAINFTWPPGSTFKIVTSSAYLTQNPNSNPQTNVNSPTQLQLPQTTHVLTNENGGGVRERQRPGQPADRVRAVVRHDVRQPGHNPWGADTQQLRRAVRHEQRYAADPDAGGPERLHHPAEPGADRVLGHRAVQRHGDAAAGGHVRGQHRQRRQADEAVPGQAGRRQQLEHSAQDDADPAEPGGFADRCDRPGPDDASCGPGPGRHGVRLQQRGRGLHDGLQDGNCPEWHE